VKENKIEIFALLFLNFRAYFLRVISIVETILDLVSPLCGMSAVPLATW
jgi:hypothetical protein